MPPELIKSPPTAPYYQFQAEKDQAYAICTCEKSSTMPFCDGSHKGSLARPEIYTAPADKSVFICACGKTANHPLCDGSHKQQPSD